MIFVFLFQEHFDAFMNRSKNPLEPVDGPSYQAQIGGGSEELTVEQLLGARMQYYKVFFF